MHSLIPRLPTHPKGCCHRRRSPCGLGCQTCVSPCWGKVSRITGAPPESQAEPAPHVGPVEHPSDIPRAWVAPQWWAAHSVWGPRCSSEEGEANRWTGAFPIRS